MAQSFEPCTRVFCAAAVPKRNFWTAAFVLLAARGASFRSGAFSEGKGWTRVERQGFFWKRASGSPATTEHCQLPKRNVWTTNAKRSGERREQVRRKIRTQVRTSETTELSDFHALSTFMQNSCSNVTPTVHQRYISMRLTAAPPSRA